MTKKKVFTIAGAVLGAVILILIVWLVAGGSNKMPSDPNEIVYVTSVSDIVSTGSLGMTAKYSGVVEPEKTLSVYKDDTKKISELYVTVGQEVEVGDKLFSYDMDDLNLQLEEAQLQLDNLTNRISTLNQQISSLQKEKNSAPSSEQFSYTLQIQSAQLEVKSTEYDKSAKAKEIEQLKKSLENADVTAEMAGVIKQINDGTDIYGSNSGAYITILATSTYRVKGTATELNIYDIQEGMRMKVISRVDPEMTWSGTIESIEREASSDTGDSNIYYGSEDSFTSATKYNFYIILDDFDGLMLGQHVYAEPESEEIKTGLWLPSYYIVNEGSKNYVWAADGKNRIEKREITLGGYDEMLSEYEILSGINEEDKLAVADERVHSGMYATDDMSYLNVDMPEDEFVDDEYFAEDDMYMDEDMNVALVEDGAVVESDAVIGGADA